MGLTASSVALSQGNWDVELFLTDWNVGSIHEKLSSLCFLLGGRGVGAKRNEKSLKN